MKRIKRTPHKKTAIKVEPFKPLLEVIGTDEDPCFGNFLITDDACKRCGDSEACSIRTQHLLSHERKALSSKKKYRDEEDSQLLDERDAKIKALIKKKKALGVSTKDIRALITSKFNLNKEQALKFLPKTKKK